MLTMNKFGYNYLIMSFCKLHIRYRVIWPWHYSFWVWRSEMSDSSLYQCWLLCSNSVLRKRQLWMQLLRVKFILTILSRFTLGFLWKPLFVIRRFVANIFLFHNCLLIYNSNTHVEYFDTAKNIFCNILNPGSIFWRVKSIIFNY